MFAWLILGSRIKKLVWYVNNATQVLHSSAETAPQNFLCIKTYDSDLRCKLEARIV